MTAELLSSLLSSDASKDPVHGFVTTPNEQVHNTTHSGSKCQQMSFHEENQSLFSPPQLLTTHLEKARLICMKFNFWKLWNDVLFYFANLRTFSLFYHHDWLIAFNQTSNWCNFWNIRTCSHFSLWSKERHLFVTPMWFLEQIVPIWANAGRKVVHPLNLSLDPIYFQVKKLVKGYIFLELETLSIQT